MEDTIKKNEIFTLLKNYPSTLEVQLMIDQTLQKFEKKKIAPLLHNNENNNNQNHTNAGGSSKAESRDWMETLVKAQVEDYFMNKLPSLVELEVEKRMAARTHSHNQNNDNNSVPRERSPPPLPRPPVKSTTTPVAPAAELKDLSEPASTTSPSTDGQKTREMILTAVHDVEHQLNTLQKEVNELAHQQRTARRRVRRLCEALEGNTTVQRTVEAVADQLPALEESYHALPKDVSTSNEKKLKEWKTLYAVFNHVLDQGETQRAAQLAQGVLEGLLAPSKTATVAAEDHVSTQLFPPSPQGPPSASPTPPRLAQVRHAEVARTAFHAVKQYEQATGHPYSQKVSSPSKSSPRKGSNANNNNTSFKLGIDAVNVPSGVLPRVLGARGGVKVLSVVEGHSASKVGVLPGDVIISLSTLRQKEQRIQTCTDLQEALRDVNPGEEVKLDVYRHAQHRLTSIKMKVE
ncbi:PDZ domain containing protein, putative [Angomonas deanei]|uniref:PDZ domain containing protein, putative n=1 Tax=Angomonas deanei TaxID=59799 RepID=A0A7G2CXA1_9TRYP|nr:PDZ domain containing protein, putative [Angomonas deanei]